MSVRSELESTNVIKLKGTEGLYGIEIETETKDASEYPDNFFSETDVSHGVMRYKTPSKAWIAHDDNSLRHFGKEFVLSGPRSFDASCKALDEFGEITKGVKFIQNSPSTSVHIHVNMQNESVVGMATFMTLYALFESLLVNYSGVSRRSNLFALPMRVAEVTVKNIKTMLSGFKTGAFHLISQHPSHVKYAALNLAPLTSFGSLEIRSFRGSTDPEEIKKWLSLINRLVVYSRRDGMTPRVVIDEFMRYKKDYLYRVFGSDALLFISNNQVVVNSASAIHDDEESQLLVSKNIWYAFCISETVEDWSLIETSLSAAYKEKDRKPNKKTLHINNPSIQPEPSPFGDVLTAAVENEDALIDSVLNQYTEEDDD